MLHFGSIEHQIPIGASSDWPPAPWNEEWGRAKAHFPHRGLTCLKKRFGEVALKLSETTRCYDTICEQSLVGSDNAVLGDGSLIRFNFKFRCNFYLLLFFNGVDCPGSVVVMMMLVRRAVVSNFSCWCLASWWKPRKGLAKAKNSHSGWMSLFNNHEGWIPSRS